MTVVNLTDIRYTKQFQRAQELLLPLAEYARADPAFSMAAAAMWIGYELSKLPAEQNPAAVRELLIWFIDAEAGKAPPQGGQT